VLQRERIVDFINSLVRRYPKQVCALGGSGRSHGQLPVSPVEVICSTHSTEIRSLTPPKACDILRQSDPLPFSYVTPSVVSTDGNAHDVKLYTDISAEWVSGDNNLATGRPPFPKILPSTSSSCSNSGLFLRQTTIYDVSFDDLRGDILS